MNNDHASLIRAACDGWHVRPTYGDPAGIEHIFSTRTEAIAYLTANCPTDASTSATAPRGADLVTPDENKIT